MNSAVCPVCTTSVPSDAPAGLCPECLLRHGLPGFDETTYVPRPQRPRHELPRTEELEAAFPNLEILEFIGAGGMGAVYRARQTGLDRIVALKVLHHAFSQDAAFADRFTREARAMARLNHPHIVGVYESGQSGAYYYLLMEYVDGMTLREHMVDGKLDAVAALSMAPRICDALEYAHNAGVVHRDIKPENILIDRQGQVKIADFGLAKLTGNRTDPDVLTQPQQVMGTPHYMAPEQMRGEQGVDHRADIYSLGVVIYEMLTGQLPIGRFDPPSQRVAIDIRIDDVVLRTLEQDPNRRYQCVGQVKTEIDSICHEPHYVPRRTRRPIGPNNVSARRSTTRNLAVCGLLFLMTFLPWGHADIRSKLDIDFQFMMDRSNVGEDSIYQRLAGFEVAFLPEGQTLNAWNSSTGIRPVVQEGPVTPNWAIAIPNGTIAVIVMVIAILLAYRRSSYATPSYLIPSLSVAGGLLTAVAFTAVSRRGHPEPTIMFVLLGFLWLLSTSIGAVIGDKQESSTFSMTRSRSSFW